MTWLSAGPGWDGWTVFRLHRHCHWPGAQPVVSASGWADQTAETFVLFLCILQKQQACIVPVPAGGGRHGENFRGSTE